MSEWRDIRTRQHYRWFDGVWQTLSRATKLWTDSNYASKADMERAGIAFERVNPPAPAPTEQPVTSKPRGVRVVAKDMPTRIFTTALDYDVDEAGRLHIREAPNADDIVATYNAGVWLYAQSMSIEGKIDGQKVQPSIREGRGDR